MTQILNLFLFTILGLSLSSCLMPNEKGKITLNLSPKDQATRNAGKAAGGKTAAAASVTQVQLINDQIKITGSDLAGVNKVKLTQGGVDSILSIASQSANQLLLSAGSQIVLGLNTLMSLTLEDAYGATVVSVTFNLPDSSVSTAKIGDAQVTTAKIADGAITAVKLSSMGAATGQLLKYNGTAWAPSDLNALTYAGTWDASLGDISPNVAAVNGEYYIVSATGTADPGDGNSRTWAQGDWIVYNTTTSSWDQISNSSAVTSFNSRTGGIIPTSGDYTWAQIDKTTSSVGDIADVDLTSAPANGQVLKFNGTSWSPAAENTTAVSASAPLSSSGGASPNITISQASGSGDGYLSSIDWTTFNNKQNAITTGTTAQYLKGDLSLGTFATDVQGTSLSSYAVGTSTALATTDSVSGAFGKVQGQINATNTALGNYVLKAGDTMTGTLNLPANGLV